MSPWIFLAEAVWKRKLESKTAQRVKCPKITVPKVGSEWNTGSALEAVVLHAGVHRRSSRWRAKALVEIKVYFIRNLHADWSFKNILIEDMVCQTSRCSKYVGINDKHFFELLKWTSGESASWAVKCGENYSWWKVKSSARGKGMLPRRKQRDCWRGEEETPPPPLPNIPADASSPAYLSLALVS